MGFYSERVFPLLLRRATADRDDDRRALLADAAGRVLELGLGDGANLPWYGSGVTEVVGLEPSEALLAGARQRVEALRASGGPAVEVRLVSGTAESLDFEDASFDTVVAFLVFCSMSDPARAAREAYRVLRPGGRLLLFEHVRAETAGLRLAQRIVNPLWRRLACGCNLTRDTLRTIAGAGFRVDSVEQLVHADSMKLTSPKLRGAAYKPAGRVSGARVARDGTG